MRRQLLTATAVALTLSLAACGGSGDGADAGSDEAKAADAISKQLTSESESTFQVTEEQGDCIGEGFVDRIGVDQLQEYGVLTEELTVDSTIENVKMSQEDADAAAETMVECVDTQELMLDAMSQGQEFTDEQRACLEGALDDETIKDFLSTLFSGGDPTNAQGLMTSVTECLAP